MARTVADITAALKTEYPTIIEMVNGETVVLDATAYEARIAEWAVNVRQHELDAEEDAAEEKRRQQAKALYDALKAGTATNRQVQGVLAFLLRREFRELAP